MSNKKRREADAITPLKLATMPVWNYLSPAASRSIAALSVFSHGKCSRPK